MQATPVRSNATLFTRNDEVEAQWRICDLIVEAWGARPGPACPGGQLRSGLAGTEGGGGAACARTIAGAPILMETRVASAVLERSGTAPTRSKRHSTLLVDVHAEDEGLPSRRGC